MSKRLCVIFMGGIGQIPFAGMAWEALHYLEGFRRLGHDVYYIEDTNAWPYDPEQNGSYEDCSHAVDYISRLMDWANLSARWAYRAAEPDGRVYGLSESRFSQLFHIRAPVLLGLKMAELVSLGALVGTDAGHAFVAGYFTHLVIDRALDGVDGDTVLHRG